MNRQTVSDLRQADWANQPRKALGPVEVVARLSRLEGWSLSGDGAEVAIEKTFRFLDYYQTLAFVNAVALVAHRNDHHPELRVRFGDCSVRWNTHDAQGLTATDFLCAAAVDALLSPHP